MPTWEIGRNFRVFDAAESSYGTAASLAATDAIRHIGGNIKHNPFNYANDPTRARTPTLSSRRIRRETAEVMLRGEFWPSGTINTVCDMDALFTDAIGLKYNITNGTTVEASPSPTSTVFTVASAGSMDATGGVVVNLSTGREIRPIVAINGAEITVAPALSAAPAAGNSVKSCVVYRPGTLATPVSHDIAAYGTNRKYEALGWVLDKLTLTFDSNGEIIWEISGPAKTRRKGSSVQSEPGSFTTAGTSIPSGLVGSLRLGSAAEEFVKAKFDLINGHAVQNNAYGTSAASAAYRKEQHRMVRFSLTQMCSDDVTVFDASEAGTTQAGLLQTGTTEGQIIGLYFPTWQIDEPPGHDLAQVSDYMEEFTGQLLGTSTGNDEFRLLLG